MMPIPDPRWERTRSRVKTPDELPSPLEQGAHLRFLPSKRDQQGYLPALQEVAPDHWVAEHDSLNSILGIT